MTTAEIGVIGGSGFYAFRDGEQLLVDTPYGAPSDPIVVAPVGGRQVAFLPRHGRDHQWPPHKVPYQANLWALHQLGVRQILAPCAVGSLVAAVPPGALVVPDQLIDRTSGRPRTFYDGPHTVHIAFADPYCPVGRATVLATAAQRGVDAVDGGTMVVVDGPRFSTRAESRSYAAAGGTLINMTGAPEAALARELAMCYSAIALVTDYDVGVDGGAPVTQEEVFRVFGANIDRVRLLLEDVIAALPAEPSCACRTALDGLLGS